MVVYPFGGVGDPLGGTDGGVGTPEVEEGEWSEFFLEDGAQVGGGGVDVRDFAAICGVEGARGDGVVDGGVHVEPPEEVGTGECGVK